ncbi:MAG: PrsW family glutamic-type intramembrane protease [Paludibacteraceae bacterium]|nr:PrsW family glutamic-type intramembrane protease [Paludibacteraceae bacterium]
MNEEQLMVLAGLAPALILMVYIYIKDRHHPEPLSLWLKGILFGVLSVVLALAIEIAVRMWGWVPPHNTFFHAVQAAFVGAAFPEEVSKFFMLWLLLRKNKYFDERFDGIVYATCVGLGFAATENVIYLFANSANWQTVAVSRAMFSVPGHFFFAIAMGFFYSRAYFKERHLWNMALVILVPTMLHGIYDSLLYMVNINRFWTWVVLLLFWIFCICMLHAARRRIAKQLADDTKAPVLIPDAPEWQDEIEADEPETEGFILEEESVEVASSEQN